MKNWTVEIDLLEGKDTPVYQKKKLPKKDKEGNIIIRPVLPPKRSADDPNKPLYIKKSKACPICGGRNPNKYKALWEKVNSKKV